jgi:hypothetical protein
VFDLSNKNNGLVIDQNVSGGGPNVQISIGGDVITNENGIYLEEPKSAILSANKFLLGTDDTEYHWEISTTPMNVAITRPQYASIT